MRSFPYSMIETQSARTLCIESAQRVRQSYMFFWTSLVGSAMNSSNNCLGQYTLLSVSIVNGLMFHIRPLCSTYCI